MVLNNKETLEIGIEFVTEDNIDENHFATYNPVVKKAPDNNSSFRVICINIVTGKDKIFFKLNDDSNIIPLKQDLYYIKQGGFISQTDVSLTLPVTLLVYMDSTSLGHQINFILQSNDSKGQPQDYHIITEILNPSPILSFIKSKLKEGKVDISDMIILDLSERIVGFKEDFLTAFNNLQNNAINSDLNLVELYPTIDLSIRPILQATNMLIKEIREILVYSRIKSNKENIQDEINNLLPEATSEFLRLVKSLNELVFSRTQALRINAEDIDNILLGLENRVHNNEEILDKQLFHIHGKSLINLAEKSPYQLLRLCEATILRSHFSSRQDIPFDPNLFVTDPAIDDCFESFVVNILSHPGSIQRIFLLVASLGMGKTWNAVHLSLKQIRDRGIPVFFFSLSRDISKQLSQYFNTIDSKEIGEICANIKEMTGHPLMLILDGFDEIQTLNDNRMLFELIKYLIGNFSNSVFFLFTCRLVDILDIQEIRTNMTALKTSIFKDIGNTNVETSEMNKLESAGIYTSLIISELTPIQINQLIERYSLDYQKMDKDLLEFCKMPFFIRLFSSYISKQEKYKDEYPKPKDISSFYPLFTDEYGTYDTILGRMGIVRSVMHLFLDILNRFPNLDATIEHDEDFENMIGNRRPEWNCINSSGIFEIIHHYRDQYSITPRYKMLIAELREKSDIEPSKSIYNGVLLFSEEVDVLFSIESMLGKVIPVLDKIDYASFGYMHAKSHVVALGLSFKNLSYIPRNIGYLRRLEKLYLTRNKLTEIPDSVGNLLELKELYLGGNLLKSLPVSLGNIPGLRILYIRRNLIKTNPKDFLNQKNLIIE